LASAGKTRKLSAGKSPIMAAAAGRSKYSAPEAHTPKPTLPTQSATWVRSRR
jgi:hypothetical protein